MNIINRISYHIWNVGFIERSVEDVVASEETEFEVHWVKHPYKDRFFADPFILQADEREIKVLVEDFPYYHKKGMISLLTINRNSYELTDRKVLLRQPFHMSYPFICRADDGSVKWVAPEASESGNLYRYTMNPQTSMLEGKQVLHDEPLLDSTILEHRGRYWLFCTKRGAMSNHDLYIYYSDAPEGPWQPHALNPVVRDATQARPGGNLLKVGDKVYRLSQKCDRYYGESISVTLVTRLSETEFKEEYVKQISARPDEYSHGFHTLNGIAGGNITVVDGLRNHFDPLRRVAYELVNKMRK